MRGYSVCDGYGVSGGGGSYGGNGMCRVVVVVVVGGAFWSVVEILIFEHIFRAYTEHQLSLRRLCVHYYRNA